MSGLTPKPKPPSPPAPKPLAPKPLAPKPLAPKPPAPKPPAPKPPVEAPAVHPKGLGQATSGQAGATRGDTAPTTKPPLPGKSNDPRGASTGKAAGVDSAPATKPSPAGKSKESVAATTPALTNPSVRERQLSRPAPAGKATAPTGPTTPRLSPEEQAERLSYERQYHGVGYGFDQKQPAMGEVERLMTTLKAEMGEFLFDRRAVLRVETWASRPGSEAYNLKLTEERAQVLANLLRKQGFIGHIEKVPHGEALPHFDHTPMALDRPAPRSKDNAQDDATDRVAIVTNIVHLGPPVDFEAELAPSDQEEERGLNQAMKSGEATFKVIANDIGERARNLFPIDDNPFGDEPSADPAELGAQVGEQAKEVVKAVLSGPKAPAEVAKILAKYTLGTLFEGVVREKWKAEVAAKRMPLYAAFADGAAGALDPTFVRTMFSDPNQQKMSDSAYDALSRLSEIDKENVTQYLVEDARRGSDAGFGTETSSEWVTSHSTGGEISHATRIWFERDYYQRE